MSPDYFLDTSVILGALSKSSPKAFRLVYATSRRTHTIEYVLREIYHVLKKRGHAQDKIQDALESIRKSVIVHRTPPAIRFKKLSIRDKSDRPIVYAARSLGCILVIDDEQTYEDAKAYVNVLRPDDL